MLIPAGHPLTVDLDEILECDIELNDVTYDDKLLELFVDLCLGEVGLVDELLSADLTGIWVVFISKNGSEYPPASHGVLLRLEPLHSLDLRNNDSSEVGVAAWGGLVVSSVVVDVGV